MRTKPQTFYDLVSQDQRYKIAVGSPSPKTIENYDRYLNRFFTFGKITDPKDITEEMVRKYRLWLNRQADSKGKLLQKKTQNSKPNFRTY